MYHEQGNPYCTALPEHPKTSCSQDPLPDTGPTGRELPSNSLLQEKWSDMKGFIREPCHGLQLAPSKYISLGRSLQFRLEKLQGSWRNAQGAVTLFPFLWKAKNSLKRASDKGRIILSLQITLVDVLKLCVIIHHYQPLSKLSWAHQLLARCFHLFFFFFLKQRVLLSSARCKLK